MRVVIADDSAQVRTLLTRVLSPRHGFEVVGAAHDGQECVELVREHRPDLIITDVDMPRLDGLEVTRQVMHHQPTPILIFTSSTISQRRNVPLKALAAGALDVFTKPLIATPADYTRVSEALRTQARTLSRVRPQRLPTRTFRMTALRGRRPRRSRVPALIAVGASTGGPGVLPTVLGALPRSGSPPVLVVQHMDPSFVPGFAEWLDFELELDVRLAAQGMRLEPGHLYVAPAGAHLRLDTRDRLALDHSPPLHACRPAVDVLFSSVSQVIGARAIGVLLTGMGRDGAEGLRQMHQRGAVTIAQSGETCVVHGMPRAAEELGAAAHVLEPAAIAELLVERVGGRVWTSGESG